MRFLLKICFSVLLISSFCVTSLFAQSPFEKGTKLGQVGIGYGFAGIYGTTSVPPISLGFQYGIEQKISIGGILGYTSSTYDLGRYNGVDYSWTYTYILIGARGEYHFLENSENMDGYAGATLGYAIASFSEPNGYSGYYTAGGSYMVFGVHIGLRYFFNPNIALFGELGYGVGYITVGVAFKL